MASVLKVDKLDPQSGTALEIGTSGDTITVPSGASLTLTDSTLSLPTTINTDKLDPKSGTDLELGSSGDTITIPSGATFTQSGTMNASAITTGTIDTARLGSGTASSSTVLYGDQTYKAEPGGGKLLSTATRSTTTSTTFSTTSYAASDIYATITPTAASSKILVLMNYRIQAYQGSGTTLGGVVRLYSNIDSAGFNAIYPTAGSTIGALAYTDAGDTAERSISAFQTFTFLDSPSYTLTDSIVYKLYGRKSYTDLQVGGSSREMQTILIEIGA